MKKIRGKQQNGKDQRSLKENQRYQGNFHAKMGTIKDRNIMDLTEAKNIMIEVARIHRRTVQKRFS